MFMWMLRCMGEGGELMTVRRTGGLVAALAIALLFAVACGDGEKDNDQTGAVTTPGDAGGAAVT